MSINRDIPEDVVLDAFFTHALRRRLRNLRLPLTLPHHGPQDSRLLEALRLCNQLMFGIGQPHYGHICDKCLRIFINRTGEERQYFNLFL